MLPSRPVTIEIPRWAQLVLLPLLLLLVWTVAGAVRHVLFLFLVALLIALLLNPLVRGLGRAWIPRGAAVALVYLANAILGLLPEIGGAKISLQRLLGYLMAPICWLMGLPWPQAVTAGGLMGIKTVLNELIAYVEFSKLGADALDPRSRLIMLYAMCGFANFASLGIMIGGLGTMAPERREEINALGLKSIVSGTLTTCLMGAIVGVLN